MKYRVRFDIVTVLGIALVLSVLLTRPTNAFNPVFTSPPFNSPPASDEGGDSEPPPEERGQVHPESGSGDRPVRDPQTPGYTFRFPAGAVSVPVQVRVYNSGVPAGTPGLAHQAGSPFFFGVWGIGEGKTIRRFEDSITISVKYDARELSSFEEERLHLYMYNPAIQAWIKLGGEVDIFDNVISGVLATLTPFQDGNTLFAPGVDTMPPLEQRVDEHGVTTLWGTGFRFYVPPGTVEVGTHFEVTLLPLISSADGESIWNAIDIRAYFIDHSQAGNSQQFVNLARPITIELDTNMAGDCPAGKTSIVMLRDGEWVGLVTTHQAGGVVSADTDTLGTFGVACRQ